MIRIMARRMKGGIAMYRHVWVGLMIVTSIPGFLGVCAGERTYAATLPVYEVTQQGVTDEQLKKLSEALKVPVARLGAVNGPVSLTDTAAFLVMPKRPVTDATIRNRLLAATPRPSTGAAITTEGIDVDALRGRPVFDESAAQQAAAALFAGAGLRVDTAGAVVSHTVFSASYTDESGKQVAIDKPVDTRVSYQFSTSNGYPLTGPGAHAEVTFDGQGHVTQLRYAARELREGPSVEIIPEAEARTRVAKRLSEGAKLDVKLVYWSPPFDSGIGAVRPAVIIPWYSYAYVTEVKNPATGAVSQARSKERLIPATDDPRFVPTATLHASADRGTEVSAQVEVTGGRPPYIYTWVGSNPAVTPQTGASVRYTPMVRAVRPAGRPTAPGQLLATQEVVGVNVTDANGVTVTATQVIPVRARPISGGASHGSGASYGCESPGEPEEWTQERVGWQQGMANPGGGTQKFCWLGDASWPGDYIKPPKPGTLPSQPWIYGDIDYANWGVNTANLVLINGDGWPDGFTAMFPGAPQSAYNGPAGAVLIRPASPGGTVDIGGTYYNVNYNGSWGPTGPNDRLYWLAGLLCDTLDGVNSSNLNTGTRWGPAFGGLHIFTGFASGAAYSAGAFPKAFAQYILGTGKPTLSIVNAWFAASTDTSEGTAAAMGPVGAGGVTDLGDFYIGKGPLGPTILPASVKGWWYLHQ